MRQHDPTLNIGGGSKPTSVWYFEGEEERKRREIGPSRAVERLLAKYGSVSTRKNYLVAIALYLRWLRTRGVTMSPDELVRDNLVCVFRSDPTEVEVKRRHTDWLDEFVNGYLVERGYSESHRRLVAAGIQQLYKRNDSALFGDFSVSRQAEREPRKPLRADDVRQVLKSLPLGVRTPLLLEWQSGMEVSRVLGLAWAKVSEKLEKGERPMLLQFGGRKSHRRPYATYIGTDSIEHLRMWRRKTAEVRGREPGMEELVFVGKRGHGANAWWLDSQLKLAAARLHREGLVENGEPGSWHTHALRHSFSSECSHAGVKPEVREYWMGHVSGIAWVYQHPELHQGDMAAEYAKVEPFVSLDRTETVVRQGYEERERAIMSEFLQLKREYEELKGEIRALRSERPSRPEGG